MELDAADLMSVKLEVESLIEVNHIQVDDVQQDAGDHEWFRYWDDTNGKELREDLVVAARKDEIDEVRRMKVWTKVPLSQCREDGQGAHTVEVVRQKRER